MNVLMAQYLKAVRLDEGGLTLHALTPQGEASMPLHPTCREDRYLRLVREFLSGHALGSPGGYPVHLTRWTRHGQLASPDLGKLLLTGEPEAGTAVVYAPGLSDDLAEYAWWAMPSIENARLMLRREAVAQGRMGKVLADFLIEHLPFLQDEHLAIIDTVAVVLASGAVDQAGREAIWRRGKRANSHYVAFLEIMPHELPSPRPARVDLDRWQAPLQRLADGGNTCASLLLDAMSSQGQTFLATFTEIFDRPQTQEVVSRTLNAAGWKQNRQDPVTKTLPSKLFNAVTSLVAGIRLHDFNCGFKLYRRDVVDAIDLDGELHRFMPALANWRGFKVGEVPVHHRARRFGKSKFGASRFMHGLFDLVTVMFLTRRGRSPLYFFGALALVFFAAGVLIDGYFLVLYLMGHGLRVRPLMLLGVGLVIVAIQIGSMGLLAEMLSSARSERETWSFRERL